MSLVMFKRKVTILVPSYNRQVDLSRLVQYFVQLKFPYLICICDSSDAGVSQENRRMCEQFSDVLEIEYWAYPPETDVFDKCVDALERVQTEYVVFCADDDFLLLDSLNNSQLFLEQNPDFVGCQGQCLALYFVLNSEGQRVPVVRHQCFSFARNEETAADRIWQNFHHFSHTFCCLSTCCNA